MKVPREEIETLARHCVLKDTTGVYAKHDPDYLRAATGALVHCLERDLEGSDRWVAVHTLSRLIRGKPPKVEKRS
jgi:hypothetical protein